MKNLKIQRVVRGFTQFDVFLKTGVSQCRLSLMENGYVMPKKAEKCRIAKALGCRVEDIFPDNGGVKNGN